MVVGSAARLSVLSSVARGNRSATAGPSEGQRSFPDQSRVVTSCTSASVKPTFCSRFFAPLETCIEFTPSSSVISAQSGVSEAQHIVWRECESNRTAAVRWTQRGTVAEIHHKHTTRSRKNKAKPQAAIAFFRPRSGIGGSEQCSGTARRRGPVCSIVGFAPPNCLVTMRTRRSPRGAVRDRSARARCSRNDLVCVRNPQTTFHTTTVSGPIEL